MRPSARSKGLGVQTSQNKKALPSQVMEKETQMMEEKLKQLKRQMETEKQLRENKQMNNSQSRWATASKQQPLKNFSKQVIQQKNDFIKQTGGKLGGTGSFQKKTPSQQSQQQPFLSKTQQLPLKRQGSSQSSRQNSSRNGSRDQRTKNNKENSISGLNNMINQQELQQNTQSQGLQNNLQKHLDQQKQQEPEHLQFLRGINLLQYADRFVEHGFDELDTILEFDTEHLNSMMIPAGHQIKIMKKVKSLRADRNMDTVPVLQQQPTQSQPQPQQKQEKKVIKPRTDLVELEYNPGPTEKHSISIGTEDNNDKKSNGISQPQATKKGAFDGEYDEKESHNSFLEALMEFRGQKPEQQPQQNQETNNKDKKRKSVRFADDVEDNEKQSANNNNNNDDGAQKKGLFFMGGKSEYDNSNYHPSNADTDTQTRDQAPAQEKICCWECYKVVQEKSKISSMGKNFCGQQCLGQFTQFQTIQCSSEKCKKQCMKNESLYDKGAWYCGEKCVPSIEEMVLRMRQSQQFENNNKENSNQNSNKNITTQNIQENQSVLDQNEVQELERSFVKTKQEYQDNRKTQQQQNLQASSLLELEGYSL